MKEVGFCLEAVGSTLPECCSFDIFLQVGEWEARVRSERQKRRTTKHVFEAEKKDSVNVRHVSKMNKRLTRVQRAGVLIYSIYIFSEFVVLERPVRTDEN